MNDIPLLPRLNHVIKAVIEERYRQETKWGEQNHDPFTYLAILGEEVGEANNAALEARFGKNRSRNMDHYKEELIQVAAVAVAMIECIDRDKWQWPKTDNNGNQLPT